MEQIVKKTTGFIEVNYPQPNPYEKFFLQGGVIKKGQYNFTGSSFNPSPDEYLPPIFPSKLGKTHQVEFQILKLSEIVANPNYREINLPRNWRVANIIELAAFHEQHGFPMFEEVGGFLAIVKFMERPQYWMFGMAFASSKIENDETVINRFWSKKLASGNWRGTEKTDYYAKPIYVLVVKQTAAEIAEEKMLFPVIIYRKPFFFSKKSIIEVFASGYELVITEPSFVQKNKQWTEQHTNCVLKLPEFIEQRIERTGLFPCVKIFFDKKGSKCLTAYFD